MRQPQIQTHRVSTITADGDGDWTVTLANGAYLTVCPDDLPRSPQPGDYILVQLPIAVGFGDREALEMSAETFIKYLSHTPLDDINVAVYHLGGDTYIARAENVGSNQPFSPPRTGTLEQIETWWERVEGTGAAKLVSALDSLGVDVF